MQKIFLTTLLLMILAGCADTTITLNPSSTRQTISPEDQTTANNELKKLAENIGTECNAVVDVKKAQYIIGYGSLMQEASRKRSVPNAEAAYPVQVNGYRRGWFAKGSSVGFDTTYLGVVPDKANNLNAVIFKITADEIPVMDKREFFYCRLAVKPNDYKVLLSETPMLSGQVWIYVNKPDSIAKATLKYPIVQSYVDIFVSGCQEQEEHYKLNGFSKECLATTSDWSTAWANDRLYPRRPFIFQPKANQIDKLLQEYLPDYFQHIYIESTI
jgi:hypothetical protein